MSSFAAPIFKAILCLVVTKGRNVVMEKLKEGDITHEQLRKLLVSQLGDINSKIDGIARRELLASISIFQEGLTYLYKVKPNEEDGKKTQQGEDSAATPLKQDVGSSETSGKTFSFDEEMRSLQLTDRDNSSARAFNDAKDRFKQARKKATLAFCNNALSTPDRLLAMQYRIMATILEKVDYLSDSLDACRFYLKELHSMPAVKKSLDVHLQQGFMSMFNKAEREDIIRSVCLMNRMIFYIAEMVEEDVDISEWPCIDVRSLKYKINPLRDVRITETLEKENPEYFLLKTWPFFQEGEETMMFEDWFITTNTKRQLFIVAAEDNSEYALLKVFDRNGNLLQSLHLKLPVTENDGFSSPVIRDIASDRANNVFLLVQRRDLHGDLRNTVIAFDQHAKFQHEFDVNEGSRSSRIEVIDDDKVFVSAKVRQTRTCVQVYNFNGELLNSFENESSATVMGFWVLGTLDFPPLRFFYQFSEEGNVHSQYYVVSDCISHVSFLHKKEHIAILDFLFDELLLYNKNGEGMRRTKLKLSAFDANAKALTVTTQGLVAMLATHKRTGKKMIVIH